MKGMVLNQNLNAPFKIRDLDIFIRNSNAIGILDKVIPENTKVSVMCDYISSRKPFSLGTDFINTKAFHNSDYGLEEPVKCYGRAKSVGFIEKSVVTKNSKMDRFMEGLYAIYK